MALHDEILVEIKGGSIRPKFKAGDLKKRPVTGQDGLFHIGNGKYKRSSIDTMLANHSISKDGKTKGNYVKNGRRPAFRNLGDGNYELILTDQFEADVDLIGLGKIESLLGPKRARKTSARKPLPPPTYAKVKCNVDPAEIVVETIASTPFQRYFLKQKITHPTSAANGWQERLDAYFWPTVPEDWRNNSTSLQIMLQRGSKILGPNWDETNTKDQNELHSLFSEICTWGKVPLPESNAATLAFEVKTAIPAVCADQVPQKARLNSAWTKLYAILLPDYCVIFDTRVAASLTSILDPYMRQIANLPNYSPYAGLGHQNTASRGGSRPRPLIHNWPNVYKQWPGQIPANRLCRSVRDLLNTKTGDLYIKGDGTKWTLREVEAVLFMDGY